MNIKYFIDSLNELLNDIQKRGKNSLKFISDLNNVIDDFIDEHKNEDIYDILYELSYDLDSYEPNPEWRREDPSYYGDEKLEELVKEALKKIDKLIQEKENMN